MRSRDATPREEERTPRRRSRRATRPSPPRASEDSALRGLRRAQVLAEARRIVAEAGLEALTIARLEERLSFSRGVISYHFRDKEELTLALLHDAIDAIEARTRAAVAAAPTTEDRVAAVVRGMTTGFLESGSDAAWILLSYWGRLHSDHRVEAANAALFARFRSAAASLLSHRPTSQADALVVVGIVLGIVAQILFAGGALDVEAAIASGERAALALTAPPTPRRSK